MNRIPLAVLVTAAVVLAACDSSSDAQAPARTATRAAATAVATATAATPSATEPDEICGRRDLPPVFCADTSGMERATVVDIIDGDTLDVVLEGRKERVRIFGIDTPERGDRCFREASQLLETLAGEEIRMRTDVRTVDRNGRLLRYVYQPGGLSIDAMMIAAGMARAWTRDGALRDELVRLEGDAIAARTGCLWQ